MYENLKEYDKNHIELEIVDKNYVMSKEEQDMVTNLDNLLYSIIKSTGEINSTDTWYLRMKDINDVMFFLVHDKFKGMFEMYLRTIANQTPRDYNGPVIKGDIHINGIINCMYKYHRCLKKTKQYIQEIKDIQWTNNFNYVKNCCVYAKNFGFLI